VFCPPETEGTQRCTYGRRCGILKANNEDVAQILIREEARPSLRVRKLQLPETKAVVSGRGLAMSAFGQKPDIGPALAECIADA
jgi:hypothetical protein